MSKYKKDDQFSNIPELNPKDSLNTLGWFFVLFYTFSTYDISDTWYILCKQQNRFIQISDCVMKSSPGLPLGYPFKSQPELFAVGRKEEREMESEGEEELTVWEHGAYAV